jgi:hypothetical protein
MDASDIIRRNQQKAIYSDFIKHVSSVVSTTCCSTITTGIFNFSSYELRDSVLKGVKECLPCSTIGSS